MKINKNDLLKLISKNFNNLIHKLHIINVINILIDEIKKDLLQGKKIKIDNFGTFKLEEIKSKQIISVVDRKNKISKKSKHLNFTIDKKLIRHIKEEK